MLDQPIRPTENLPLHFSKPLGLVERIPREHFGSHGAWPTTHTSLEEAARVSCVGRWRRPGQSEDWARDPSGYSRGYVWWALKDKCLKSAS